MTDNQLDLAKELEGMKIGHTIEIKDNYVYRFGENAYRLNNDDYIYSYSEIYSKLCRVIK